MRAELEHTRAGLGAALPPVVEETITRARAEHLTFLKPDTCATSRRPCASIEDGGLPGLLIEAGTARGGSAIVIAPAKARERPLKVYDVFGMIPPPTEHDGPDVHERYETIAAGEARGHRRGDVLRLPRRPATTRCATSFTRLGVPPGEHNVELIRGLFEDTIERRRAGRPRPPRRRLVRVDDDLPRAASRRAGPAAGGSCSTTTTMWSGCRAAVDEYFAGPRRVPVRTPGEAARRPRVTRRAPARPALPPPPGPPRARPGSGRRSERRRRPAGTRPGAPAIPLLERARARPPARPRSRRASARADRRRRGAPGGVDRRRARAPRRDEGARVPRRRHRGLPARLRRAGMGAPASRCRTSCGCRSPPPSTCAPASPSTARRRSRRSTRWRRPTRRTSARRPWFDAHGPRLRRRRDRSRARAVRDLRPARRRGRAAVARRRPPPRLDAAVARRRRGLALRAGAAGGPARRSRSSTTAHPGAHARLREHRRPRPEHRRAGPPGPPPGRADAR